MPKKITGLTRDERVTKLVLTTTLLHSTLSNSSQISDKKLIDIISKIEHRIYYITESPTFEFKSKLMQSLSMIFNVDDFLIQTKDKYFIFYNIWSQIDISNNPITMIRGVFIDDPGVIRDNKINIILDEE